MIVLSCDLTEALALQLEAHFCEQDRSRWILFRETNDTAYELKGYFDSETGAAREWARLRDAFAALPAEAHDDQVEDEDWKEAYKDHFHPWSCRGLHWVPAWQTEEYLLQEGDKCVLLDPGQAFGTGLHETTRLCVERLLDFYEESRGCLGRKRIIDAGCGSGILALSATILGFTDVTGIDHDREAVRVSKENRSLNGLVHQPRFRTEWLSHGLSGGSGDLVLANIQADILLDSAEKLVSALKPGGWLVLSGLLIDEVDGVSDCFREILDATEQCSVWDSRRSGEWADICFRTQLKEGVQAGPWTAPDCNRDTTRGRPID